MINYFRASDHYLYLFVSNIFSVCALSILKYLSLLCSLMLTIEFFSSDILDLEQVMVFFYNLHHDLK